jgi:hypothetical protein
MRTDKDETERLLFNAVTSPFQAWLDGIHPHVIADGVEAAFAKWLDANRDAIIEAIASRASTDPDSKQGAKQGAHGSVPP